MKKLLSSSLLSTKLDGPAAEGDEFYIKTGLKGRLYHDEILKSVGRKPRKRGLKPWRGRGTFYKDHPMIIKLQTHFIFFCLILVATLLYYI